MALSGYKHHTSRGQTVDRAGEGVRGEVHGQVPGAPPPQAAGTQYFALGVDEVPAAGGSRPDRLAPVSGPQERFQRHSVEQLVEPVRGVPVLDAPVPQMVEQLVEVPVPESVLEARGLDFAGVEWRQFGLTGGIYWCMGRTTYTRRQRPVGFTASPGWDIRLRRCTGLWCGRPCALQRQVPAVQGVRPDCASDSVLQSVGHSCCGTQCKLCRRPETRQVQFLGGCRRARWCATTELWFRQCSSSTRGRAAVNMQPKLQQFSVRWFELGFRPFLDHFSDSVHPDVESRLSAVFWGALDG